MKEEHPVTILVDGLYGWHRRWEGLRKKVEKAVGPAHIWKYPNHGRMELDILGGELADYLLQLNRPFHLIGFSMGGLVARSAMCHSPTLPIRRAVFLHVPHQGSYWAHFLPFKGIRQMRPKSDFLKALDAEHWPHATLVTWCPGDMMILPNRSARWQKAMQICKSKVPAHIWPVFSPALHREVIAFLSQK